MAFKRPSASEYRSVVNYLDNEKPVTDDERSYILHREDLVTLRPGREHAWLDRSIENVLHLLHRRPFLWVHTLFSSEVSSSFPAHCFLLREMLTLHRRKRGKNQPVPMRYTTLVAGSSSVPRSSSRSGSWFC